jgi:two-component system, sensor histidine kinase
MGHSENIKRKRFSTLVRLSFIALVLLPFTLASIYLSFSHYQNMQEVSREAFNRAAQFRLAVLEQRLHDISFDLYQLAHTQDLSTFADSSGQFQFVDKALENFYQRHDDVFGVFVMHPVDGITSAAPSDFYRVNSPKMDAFTQQYTSISTPVFRPALDIISRAQLSNVIQDSEKHSYFLLMSVPIEAQALSFITPVAVNAVLWAVIDLNHVLTLRALNETQASVPLRLYAGNTLLYEDGRDQETSEEAVIAIETKDHLVDGQALRLETLQRSQGVLGLDYGPIWQTLWLLVGVWILAALVIRTINIKLQQPLLALMEETERISAGNFDTPSKGAEFEEFNTVLSHLNQMAATIDIQMRSMAQSRDQAQQSELQKTHFFTNISHELRAPLNGIQVMLDLIAKDDTPRHRQADYIASAQHACHVLQQSLDRSLDFAKMEHGGVQLINMPFNPAETIEDALLSMKANAERKGLTFELQLDPALDHTWFADPARIHQVIFNVISNAIKFTEKGSVSVHGHIEEKHQKFTLVVVVRDTGQGISAEHQRFIFDRFWQAAPTTPNQVVGSGLGLYLARHILNAMHGEIIVKSDVGVGTDVSLFIPLTALGHQENSGMNASPSSALHHDFTRKAVPLFKYRHFTILEDEQVSLELLQFMLEHTGATVTAFQHGEEFLSYLESAQTDVILMDLSLPGMSGVQVLKIMRERGYQVPVIVQSGNVIEGDGEALTELGVSDIIEKPFDALALYAVLKKVLVNSEY